jgi:hypothetical protein
MPCNCTYPKPHTPEAHKAIAHQHNQDLANWIMPESQQEIPEWKAPKIVSKAYQKPRRKVDARRP